MISFSFNPVGSWLTVSLLGIAVTSVTLWAYAHRMKTATGIWRYFALGFRLGAILICLFAALRPSVIYKEKAKQPASLVFLIDDSTSMKVNDAVDGQSRWDFARKTLDEARKFGDKVGTEFTMRYYRFNKDLKDDTPTSDPGPVGTGTAIGSAMIEASRRETGQRIASIFVLTDGANNAGLAPQTAADQLKSRSIPVVTLGFGQKTTSTSNRDIAIKDLDAPASVSVKNDMIIAGTLQARGFAKQAVTVDLLVDDNPIPVASKRMVIPDGVDQIPITGLKYTPSTTGEKKITLSARPVDGETVPSNNSVSTFVSVLKGGLNVLFIQGPHFTWEYKYFMRGIASSLDIKADLVIVKSPYEQNKVKLPTEFFTPGRYDVYVFSDVPKTHLSRDQQNMLVKAVEKGAGFIMLGGRSSFGMGGWGSTPIASLLPTDVKENDGEILPEQGVRFEPNPLSLESYLLQIAPTREESSNLWNRLPPLSGINRLGQLKPQANVLGYSKADPKDAIMVAKESGAGRSLAFAGETWNWARTPVGVPAHRRFWRQVIFWLSHKEDKGETDIKIKLDARRVSLGETLDFGVTALDAKRNPIPNVRYETKVEKDGDPQGKSSKVELFAQGDQMRGGVPTQQSTPGDYKITVTATKDGQVIGKDSARFLIYQDDLELDNPSTDLVLLRQLAEATGGTTLAPEELPKYLDSIRGKLFTESLREIDQKLWDNWPFFLIFTTFLSLEWWLRKRHGWV